MGGFVGYRFWESPVDRCVPCLREVLYLAWSDPGGRYRLEFESSHVIGPC